jgi:hypothetical protein
MKIVQFKNGTYGVRKGSWFSEYTYLDMRNRDVYFWHQQYRKEYCEGTLEQAIRRLNESVDIGKPVKL